MQVVFERVNIKERYMRGAVNGEWVGVGGGGVEKIIQASSVFGAFALLRTANITFVMSVGNDSAPKGKSVPLQA